MSKIVWIIGGGLYALSLVICWSALIVGARSDRDAEELETVQRDD